MADLKAGKSMPAEEAVDLNAYEDIVGLSAWEEIEKRFHHEEQ